jgi:excisionase family DNA binding protein
VSPNGDLIRAGKAAKLLGVSRMTLYRWTNEGRIRHFLVGPHKERRYQRKDIQALLREREAKQDGGPDEE